MCNVLKYCKVLLNVALRLRCGCVYFFNLLKTSTVPRMSCLQPILSVSGVFVTLRKGFAGLKIYIRSNIEVSNKNPVLEY